MKDTESIRQLDLLLWGRTYARERQKTLHGALDLLMGRSKTDPKPQREQYDSGRAWIDALKEWEERRKQFWSNLNARALNKADKAAIRGASPAWETLRLLVWERDKGICQVCNRQIARKDYQCGHIVDRMVGGSDRASNLVVMCTACNQLKPVHETREEYEAWVAEGGWQREFIHDLSDHLREATARMQRGMRGRVQRGLHAGSWPYGYTVLRDAAGHCIGAELVPEKAATVRDVTRRFLAGASYREIARELNDGGFPTGDGAQEWYGTKVRRMMWNDTYAGYPKWRKARPDVASSRYPHIWDASTHAAVLAERRRRRTRVSHTTPLLDVAFCDRCGGRMSRQVLELVSGPTAYVRCARHTKHGDCHSNSVQEAEVQEAITGFLAVALADPEVVRGIAASRAGTQAGLEEEFAALDAHLDETAQRRQRLALALAAGAMDPQMYRATDDVLLAELDAVSAARGSVEAQLEAVPDEAGQVGVLEELLASLPSLWERPPREAAALLQAAGVRAFCEDGRVTGVEFAV